MDTKPTNNDAVFLHEGFKRDVFASGLAVALLSIALVWDSPNTVAEICQGFFLFSSVVVGARAAQQWGLARGGSGVGEKTGVYNGIDRPPGAPPIGPPTKGV